MRYYLGRQKTNTKEGGAGRGFGHDVQEMCQTGQELGCRGRLYHSCVEVWREFRVGR